MKELKAVPAETGEGDEEGDKWCARGCGYHWGVSVSSGSLVTLDTKGLDQAYLSAEEAELIGRALLQSARIIREKDWGDSVSLSLQYHDRMRPVS